MSHAAQNLNIICNNLHSAGRECFSEFHTVVPGLISSFTRRFIVTRIINIVMSVFMLHMECQFRLSCYYYYAHDGNYYSRRFEGWFSPRSTYCSFTTFAVVIIGLSFNAIDIDFFTAHSYYRNVDYALRVKVYNIDLVHKTNKSKINLLRRWLVVHCGSHGKFSLVRFAYPPEREGLSKK